MSNFVPCKSGYVNLEQVAAIRENYTKDGTRYSFYGLNNELLGSSTSFDPELHLLNIIPANEGAIVIILWAFVNDVNEHEIYEQTVPVVAWRVDGTYCSAILIEAASDGDIVLYPMPDGSFLLPNIQKFETLDKAKMWVIANQKKKDERPA